MEPQPDSVPGRCLCNKAGHEALSPHVFAADGEENDAQAVQSLRMDMGRGSTGAATQREAGQRENLGWRLIVEV